MKINRAMAVIALSLSGIGSAFAQFTPMVRPPLGSSPTSEGEWVWLSSWRGSPEPPLPVADLAAVSEAALGDKQIYLAVRVERRRTEMARPAADVAVRLVHKAFCDDLPRWMPPGFDHNVRCLAIPTAEYKTVMESIVTQLNAIDKQIADRLDEQQKAVDRLSSEISELKAKQTPARR